MVDRSLTLFADKKKMCLQAVEVKFFTTVGWGTAGQYQKEHSVEILCERKKHDKGKHRAGYSNVTIIW